MNSNPLIPRGACALALVAFAASLEAQAKRPPAFSEKVTTIDSVYASAPAISPDGRWVAFEVAWLDLSAVAVAPAGGGPSRILTPRGEGNGQPVWFPSGDRLAYTSERMNGIVVSDFDARAGTLAGTPRRVTLESARNFDISPDGATIAYVTRIEQGHNVLRLIPSNGGRTRTLLDTTGRLDFPRFSANGRDVYVSRIAAYGNAKPVEVVRVPVGGGAVARALTGPMTGRPWNVIADPARDRVMHLEGANRLIVTTLAGDTVAAFSAGDDPGGIDGRFGRDGATFYTAKPDVGAAIRMASADARATRDLSDHAAYNWPIAWSSDSKRVFFVGDSTTHVLSASIQGGPVTRHVFSPRTKLADTARIFLESVSGDGRYVWISQRPNTARPERIHYLYDMQTRDLRTITRTGGPAGPSGPGGSWLRYNHFSKEFYYIDRKSDSREVRAITPAGASRLLRTVSLTGPQAFAVHGERVIWLEERGDSTVLMFAANATAPAKQVWSGGRLRGPVWSHDGRSIAALLDVPRGKDSNKRMVLFFDVAADGSLTETSRSVPVSDPWDMFWTRDDKGVTLLEYHGINFDTRIARVSRNSAEPVTYIVPRGTASFWDQFPSPDGNYVVIPAEVTRGSSVFRVDLTAAEADYRRRVTQAGRQPK